MRFFTVAGEGANRAWNGSGHTKNDSAVQPRKTIMANNILLRNAALAGFVAGVYAQAADVGSEDGATYAEIGADGATFANAVDALITPTDANISFPGGTAIAGANTAPATITSANIEGQSAKVALLQGIAQTKTAAWLVGSLVPGGIPSSAINDLAEDVAAAYAGAVSQLTLT
jgi:hypothetical protein